MKGFDGFFFNVETNFFPHLEDKNNRKYQNLIRLIFRLLNQ